MLRIRANQMVALEETAYGTWAQAVLPEVRRCWPGLAHEPDDVLQGRLHQAARDADQLGLTTRGQWLRYANVALALGDDFTASPEARAILAEPSPPGVRLEKLVRWTSTTLRGR
jgi:hypothetical protein